MLKLQRAAEHARRIALARMFCNRSGINVESNRWRRRWTRIRIRSRPPLPNHRADHFVGGGSATADQIGQLAGDATTRDRRVQDRRHPPARPTAAAGIVARERQDIERTPLWRIAVVGRRFSGPARHGVAGRLAASIDNPCDPTCTMCSVADILRLRRCWAHYPAGVQRLPSAAAARASRGSCVATGD